MSILKQIGLYESNKEGSLKLFVDMDGVITDFQQAFKNLGLEMTKGLKVKEFEDKYGTDALWKTIAEGGLEFWSNMHWKNDGKELWNYIKKFEPTIITTPARSKNSKEGKKIWINRELGKNIPIIMTKDKFKFANTESILIDDFINKINDWVDKGDGIGILHTSTDNTIKELKKYGF